MLFLHFCMNKGHTGWFMQTLKFTIFVKKIAYLTKLSSASGGSHKRERGCCSNMCNDTKASSLSDSVQPQNSSSLFFFPFFPNVNLVEF